MFKLTFNKSRSKFYDEVLKLSSYFRNSRLEDNIHSVEFDINECFEKWDFYNLLFWRTVDWKGSTFGYDGVQVSNHSNKTRLFYALQEANTLWVCLSESYLSQMHLVVLGKITMDELKKRVFNTKDTDFMLDLYLVAQARLDYDREFGQYKFKAPSCSFKRNLLF